MSLTLQTAIPLAQLGSRFLLACPLSHCKINEYLIIPFAFPEGAQKGWNCCGYRRWAAGLVLIWSRLAGVLSPEAPPNWKPWKTVWSWGDSRAGRRGHLGASRHQGGAGGRKKAECWAGVRWLHSAVRWKLKAPTHMKRLARMQVRTRTVERWSQKEPHFSFVLK